MNAEYVLRLRRRNGWLSEFSYWPDDDRLEYRVASPDGITRTFEAGTLGQFEAALVAARPPSEEETA